jgi:hypothetical protein
MDWIKHHPAQFALAVASVGLFASTASLLTKRISAAEAVRTTPPIAAPPLATFEAPPPVAVPHTPAVWNPGPAQGSLFVSRPYVKSGTRLESPINAMFHPPVPNRWLHQYGLDYNDPNILRNDDDGDGFDVLSEWLGLDGLSELDLDQKPVLGADGKALPKDSTSPCDAHLHPAYYTRLTVERIVSKPIELRFTTHNEDPKHLAPTSIAINNSAQGGRSFFGKVGDEIPGTPYKIASLDEKYQPGPDGTRRDVSEVTLFHQTTGQKLVLPYGEAINAPERSAILRYAWALPGHQPSVDGKPTPVMAKACNEQFTLPPESDRPYRVMEITDREVQLQLPDGGTYTLRAAK